MPVRWVLLTTLPVDSVEQVELVIDCYRRRWLIEEYFKAIKTGCAYEKRQLESSDTLLNALALFVPLLGVCSQLRYLARETPDDDTVVLIRAANPDFPRAGQGPFREGNAAPISDRDGSVEDILRSLWNVSDL